MTRREKRIMRRDFARARQMASWSYEQVTFEDQEWADSFLRRYQVPRDLARDLNNLLNAGARYRDMQNPGRCNPRHDGSPTRAEKKAANRARYRGTPSRSTGGSAEARLKRWKSMSKKDRRAERRARLERLHQRRSSEPTGAEVDAFLESTGEWYEAPRRASRRHRSLMRRCEDEGCDYVED